MERQAPNVGRMRLLGRHGGRRSTAAIARCARRSMRRCATGSSIRTAPTICWARRSAAIPIPTSCASCRRSSGARRARRCCERTGALPDARRRLRRRRLQCDRPVSCLSRRSQVEIIGVEAGGRGCGLGENAATLVIRPARRAARQLFDAAAGSGRPDPGDAFDLGGTGLSGRRPRACAAALRSVACATRPRAMTRRWRRCANAASAKASCRRSRARMRWPVRAAGPPASGRRILIGLSGRGDKDMPTLTADAAVAGRSEPAMTRRRRRWQSTPRERIVSALRAAAKHGQPALVAFLTAGFPSREAIPRTSDRRGQRSRRGRDRRAVLRPDGRWRHDPARQRAGAARRRHTRLDPGGAGSAGAAARRRCC